ncbi:MAG: MarR family transcriptional regulator [Thermoleophilaceae bacterium]|nr:MarR family transcriptional regulator [Thermoleophilaceae bacterium]
MSELTTPAELLRALRRFGLEDDRLDAIVARRFGAAPAEFKAMDHILATGGLTPGQLGDRLALSSGAVTALVDRLERLGWVKRVPHPTDRRSVIVSKASPKLSAGEAIYESFAEALAREASKMSPKERAACARFLEAAADIAAERATELRDSGPAPTVSPGRDSPPTPAA